MREDPRRRFTFGFTIEDTEMKLWYCDRSQTVASQPFNFITDHETLIHFFLSLSYASPVQLGWDPTIAIQEHDLQYRITVQSGDGTECVYRTLEVLSKSSASVLHGPGTRVWKAVRVVDGHDYGDPVVLKDCWVSCDRQREGTIHERLRNANSSDAFREAFENMFLTVEQHGDVVIDPGIQRQPDLTPLIMPPEEMKKNGYNIPPVSATLKPRAARSLWREITYTKSRHERKVHYRIVFKEICKSIKHATSLQEVFKALGEICSALKLMHQTGWVHRDVSIGNILIDSHGKARLSDLEYAKDMKDTNDPEFRIGTANFVAVEVQTQQYAFRPLNPPSVSPASDTRSITSDDLAEKRSYLDSAARPHSDSSSDLSISPPLFAFRYNPLHDLESLWWIAVYFIFTTEVANYADLDEKGQDRQLGLDGCVLRLFCDFEERKMDMIDGWDRRFLDRCQCLHPSIRPIGRDLERLRVVLVTTYAQCEANRGSITLEPLEGLHDSIQELFFSISKEISEEPTLAHVLPATNCHPVPRPVQPGSSSHNTASSSGKRSRSDSSDEESATVGNGTPIASTSLSGSRKRARIEREQEESAPRVGMQTRSKTRAQTNNRKQ
ncbi:hypothetical protein PHLCEN_2v2510 [Hermanssonia centrifuga]|uniref:Protein kinase domain-containing protein n=1 Tax=Hermanssonia centrifuga TaxID=98765 RepID=A0A2R6RLN8_9APHY|nr:hypothetical protein PHLCEN_2v2510 [Hermanssonia centrifuga]